MFQTHFSEAKNIEDKQVLTEVAKKVSLNQERTVEVLSSDEFGYEVSQDILESRNLGIRGVPFLLINKKYAVSGAQPVEAFANALKQTFEEWQKENPQIVSLNTSADGSSCSVDGCD
ncbi:MAG: DsbA family protein [Leptonema sp. (in: Bacteria)]|nr:DsbA family protein [Leptonema sp. (in: bacteria)]